MQVLFYCSKIIEFTWLTAKLCHASLAAPMLGDVLPRNDSSKSIIRLCVCRVLCTGQVFSDELASDSFFTPSIIELVNLEAFESGQNKAFNEVL